MSDEAVTGYTRNSLTPTTPNWNGPIATTYGALVAVRNAELQAHWARYNIQALLNVGFGVAVIGAREKSFIYDHPNIMAAVGAILSVVWLGFAIQSKRMLTDRWDHHLRLFEDLHQASLPYTLFCLVEAVESRRWMRALTFLQRVVPSMFLIGWIGWTAYWWWSRT